eukprot:1414093-Heterocapsa_arctica.AAC.1
MRLETITEVLHEAGHRVRKHSAKIGANTTHQRLYWMLRAMRAARTGDRRGFREAAGAYPVIFDWSNENGDITNVLFFHDHIAELARTHVDNLAKELEGDDIPEWRRAGQREVIAKKGALWSRKRKRV